MRGREQPGSLRANLEYVCQKHQETHYHRAGKMVQWLRALVALAEDPGPTCGSQVSRTPVPGDAMPSSDLSGGDTQVVQIHTNKTLKHIK